MKINRVLTTIAACLIMLTANAQHQADDYRALYEEAENLFNIGRFEDTERVLTNHMTRFPQTLRPSVYRLLALTNIAVDQEEEAEKYVRMLLQENPYYTTTPDDRQRFIDMVNRIKAGLSNTITTASSQAETLSEVPVPTTLITEEMIRNCGGRNLQEVLAAYVPGMYIIDCNDDINIAMRGIYSASQEKILFMLNGHRLNSYCTNTAAPDFSISLEKLKQIEVLRGPASSLYGGVALTAVVNLITKQGADIDGLKARAGIGTYNQYHGDLLFGKRYFDLDIMIWGSFYQAKGQRVSVDKADTGMRLSGGDITVGGIGDKPSYDFGVSLKYKDLKFFYNTQCSEIQAPMTMTHTFSPFDVDKYKTFYSVRPSHYTLSHHADLSYGRQLDNVYLKGQIAYDNSDMTQYQVISDIALPGFSAILPLPATSKALMADTVGGIARYISGQEHTFSAKVQGDWSYINNGVHKGLLTFGVEYSHFQLDDARYVFVYDFIKTLPETVNISQLGKGNENNANASIQLKHQWGPFILNAGLRYDYKARYDHTYIRELSPRLALIFLQPKWNVKLSYAKAFIDAPYLYRKTNQFLFVMLGDNTLQRLAYVLDPESMHSYQLTLGTTQLLPGLDLELNGFYNRTRDLIYMDLIEHYNMGSSDIYGLELSGKYKYRTLTAHLAAGWQKSRKYELFFAQFDTPFNMPELSADVTLAWQATKQFKLHSHMAFNSSQRTIYKNVFSYATIKKTTAIINALDEKEASGQPLTDGENEQYLEAHGARIDAYNNMDVEKHVPAYFTLDIGANYNIGRIELGLNIHNLLNRRYSLSGACVGLVPQKGRWLMFDIGYKLW